LTALVERVLVGVVAVDTLARNNTFAIASVSTNALVAMQLTGRSGDAVRKLRYW
jgi:hypothetical protein